MLALTVIVALPATTLSQGRGRDRDRGERSNWDKKCGKFVNCHDARNGRWDRRGPNRNVSVYRNGLYRNGIFIQQQRVRNREQYYDRRYRYDRQRMQYPYDYALQDRRQRLRHRNWDRRFVIRHRRY